MKITISLLLGGALMAMSPPAWPQGKPDALKDGLVRYEDGLVRLVEVTIAAGRQADLPADPFSSVTAFDGPRTELHEFALDGGTTVSSAAPGEGPAPVGMRLPACQTAGPRGALRLINKTAAPAHFYRLDIKRLDAEAIKTNWKTWYPWMLSPSKPRSNAPSRPGEKPFSKNWPFPAAYDSVKSAPDNHMLRYEDANIRVIEVVTRPGETENMHGHPYPSVFAYKGPGLTQMRNVFLEENNPLSNHGFKNAGWGAAPSGMQYPTCRTLGPEAPHSVTNLEPYPLHFYRIEFKRLAGDGK